MSKTTPDPQPRPLHVLRTLAETTARLIVKGELHLPPEALELLAGAYVEARDQIRALHDLVDQTDPNDPIGNALARVGLARRPGAWNTTEPRLVRGDAEIATLSCDQLLAIYCRVMGDIEATFVKYESFVVRLWDGMDGCWTNCTGDVSREEALRYWAEKTSGGAHHVAYAEIDYYRILPGGTHMLWDGTEEMHR
jgi:hypothetical protein